MLVINKLNFFNNIQINILYREIKLLLNISNVFDELYLKLYDLCIS
jgi:hypothetical protein